jgi:hypothetical protein
MKNKYDLKSTTATTPLVKFLNKFFYYAEDEILESDFQTFKILNYVKNVRNVKFPSFSI